MFLVRLSIFLTDLSSFVLTEFIICLGFFAIKQVTNDGRSPCFSAFSTSIRDDKGSDQSSLFAFFCALFTAF